MTDPFNRFSGFRFERQQPEHLRHIPWKGDRPTWRQIRRVRGEIVVCLAVLFVWFILVAAVVAK